MTIKPLTNQKSAKHEKKDIQDVQNQTLTGSAVRTTHRSCLAQIASSPKSPSPQREQKPQNRSVYNDVGVNRRRRSPHRRCKRDVVRERVEKVCNSNNSPTYQVESVCTPCSSTSHHSQAGKSPKSTTGHGHSSITVVSTIGNNNKLANILEETYSGYNSGDEHIGTKDAQLTPDEWEIRDKTFNKAMSDRGFVLNEIVEDGACLFRSISLQIYGDQDMHEVIRQQTMDYIFQNREYFAQFVTEDISSYVTRKRDNHVHGNHIEIQAISEIYNRPVELYCYQTKPINIFNSDQIKNGYEPLRLSYQRGSHYNAILNPYNASVGVGLGLAGYRPDEPETKAVTEAVRLSEELEIEQTMFEDKLKTTDWDATNEAIEEQIARESYIQWCRDNMQKHETKPTMNTSSSTITSSDINGGNKSPSVSGESSFESEDYTPYASDDERTTDNGASSSSTSMKQLQQGQTADNTNPLCCIQQRQRHRKRRRGQCATTSAGPSTFSTLANSMSDSKYSLLPKISRLTHRIEYTTTATTSATTTTNSSSAIATAATTTSQSTKTSANDKIIPDCSPSMDNMPGTSKQNGTTDRPMSEFYHSLLESSYGDDPLGGLGQQLSEKEMVQKALQMSRLDYMNKSQQQQQNRTDSDPPSP